MNRQPLRYELHEMNGPIQEIPAGKVLHVAKHRSSPFTAVLEVWVEVELPVRELQRLRIFGTGQPIPEGAEHVATTFDGPYVWHLYRTATNQIVEES